MNLILQGKGYLQKFLSRLINAKSYQDYWQLILVTKRFSTFLIRRFWLYLRFSHSLHPNNTVPFRLTTSESKLISVIVPNFNHGRFLKERLDSIYGQDYKNFEVLLLDDASSDESVEILENYLSRFPNNTRLIINENNSGSGYKQWIKGISQARGDLIWIAESDDVSETTFLSSLASRFQNEAMKIAFSNTIFFEEETENVIWDLNSYWHGRTLLSAKSDWEMLDSDFIGSGMLENNLIPNVSSVLFKKPSEYLLNESWGDYRYCGDWLFYIYQISGGLISYDSKVTNYYRIHAESTIKKNSKSLKFTEEIEQVKLEITNLLTRPRIMFALPGLVIGGGELFPFRMAQTCEKYGIIASIVDLGLIESINEDFFLRGNAVSVFRPKIASEFISNLDSAWDLLYSHHASADEFGAKFRPHSLPHLISLHGMYEEIDTHDVLRLENILSEKTASFTYTIEKNLSGFSKEFVDSNEFFKVSNFIPSQIIPEEPEVHSFLEDQINICLIARAIPGKGWLEAVEAVKIARELTGRNIHLHLYGSGPLNNQVSKRYSAEWLHIYPKTDNSLLTASKMHVGLFLSTYTGESMPLILMEYLSIGLPTILTSNGLSRLMMTDDSGLIGMGVAIDEVSRTFKVEDVVNAITKMLVFEDDALFETKSRMRRKFYEYSEQKNMPTYVDLFRRVVVQQEDL